MVCATNNPKYCDNVDGYTDRVYCQALYERNPSKCQKIDVINHRDNCYKLMGIISYGSVCSRIMDPQTKAECIDYAKICHLIALFST